MATTTSIDLGQIAAALSIRLEQVESVVALLDAGNTVPFITRYRKDQTGGLDEEEIRQIQARVARQRQLADRKQTILRSIESQGKLTPELAAQIEAADTYKTLEDLYLPFKPKKQTLATAARDRGLEPLAMEILSASPMCADLDARARDFINPDRGVPTAADALLGAGHILAETFSERADLRKKLREIVQRTGKLVSTGEEPSQPPAPRPAEQAASAPAPVAAAAEAPATEAAAPESQNGEPAAQQPAEVGHVAPETTVAALGAADPSDVSQTAAQPPLVEQPVIEHASTEQSVAEPPATEQAAAQQTTQLSTAAPPGETPIQVKAEVKPGPKAEAKPEPKSKGKPKDKAKEKSGKGFRDYYNYSEAINKVPPHRVLAINRGEHAKILKVKVEADFEAMHRTAEEMLVPPEHPHAAMLRGCCTDALNRLVLPSLEREVRRELTEKAEAHAVNVFARNLRNLLLQPPVHNRRVLAIDPGFRSGCKMVALDEFGNVLEHGLIHLVASDEKRAEAKTRIVDLVNKHGLTVIAIGNGTAGRDTELFVAELLANELKDQGVAYVIVNEAGASVYSTSPIGREEFPEYDATLRGAISIGRRLLDPLSELVKIDPANIGVGLYQHDVKAKHLRASLDEVVESCVNYVGVDLNTASASLLRYVSGLNQLTSRRLYEYRKEHGPFKSRDQLREIPGFGEATFVQAAGFLRINTAENPLDGTWIHPESYDAARRVLEKLECSTTDLADKQTATKVAERVAQADVSQLSRDLNLGQLLLKDILSQLARPGRDPREDLPPPIFKREVLKLEDLTPGMELRGSVLNVVDFGAFIDIGLKDSGLVHVSRMSRKFVQDPHQVVSVGDVVRVWVIEVDKERRRVSLTMVEPGTEAPPQRRPARPEGQRPQRPERRARPPRPAAAGAVPAGGGKKPQRPAQQYQKQHARPPKPKPRPPLRPLTKEMKEGKEPLRTFGDLLQFMQMQKPDESNEAAPS